jgi:hypothetical protein
MTCLFSSCWTQLWCSLCNPAGALNWQCQILQGRHFYMGWVHCLVLCLLHLQSIKCANFSWGHLKTLFALGELELQFVSPWDTCDLSGVSIVKYSKKKVFKIWAQADLWYLLWSKCSAECIRWAIEEWPNFDTSPTYYCWPRTTLAWHTRLSGISSPQNPPHTRPLGSCILSCFSVP